MWRSLFVMLSLAAVTVGSLAATVGAFDNSEDTLRECSEFPLNETGAPDVTDCYLEVKESVDDTWAHVDEVQEIVRNIYAIPGDLISNIQIPPGQQASGIPALLP